MAVIKRVSSRHAANTFCTFLVRPFPFEMTASTTTLVHPSCFLLRSLLPRFTRPLNKLSNTSFFETNRQSILMNQRIDLKVSTKYNAR